MIFLFLVDGFEVTEALATVDMLRRAKLNVKTVGVNGKTICSSHGIKVEADVLIDDIEFSDAVEAVILPGGPGTPNLEKSEKLLSIVKAAFAAGKYVCAICAAPSVLGHLGLLEGKEATCFPGYENDLHGARLSSKAVCADGNIITAKGCGVSIGFGLKIVEKLCGAKTAECIRESIQHD